LLLIFPLCDFIHFLNLKSSYACGFKLFFSDNLFRPGAE
jgi:hypothetical protein